VSGLARQIDANEDDSLNNLIPLGQSRYLTSPVSTRLPKKILEDALILVVPKRCVAQSIKLQVQTM
jgi:hypothetical protein